MNDKHIGHSNELRDRRGGSYRSTADSTTGDDTGGSIALFESGGIACGEELAGARTGVQASSVGDFSSDITRVEGVRGNAILDALD